MLGSCGLSGALQCREGRCVEPDRCFDDGQCQGERICFDLHCTDRCGEDMPCRGTQVCEDGVCIEVRTVRPIVTASLGVAAIERHSSVWMHVKQAGVSVDVCAAMRATVSKRPDVEAI